MSKEKDIELIIRQENELVFDELNGHTAFRLGMTVRDIATREGQAVAMCVRLWDRQLFSHLMDGMTSEHENWMRRKFNAVRQFHQSTYRLVLERGWPNGVSAHSGVDLQDFAFAGGAFPLNVAGAGKVGALIVSGLHEREDHQLAVEAVCACLGHPFDDYRLG